MINDADMIIAVAVLSRGEDGSIIKTGDKKLCYMDIVKIFTSTSPPNLVENPKLFIFSDLR